MATRRAGDRAAVAGGEHVVGRDQRAGAEEALGDDDLGDRRELAGGGVGPPTMAIDGVAVNARAAQVVASAREELSERGMAGCNAPGARTCGQAPAKRTELAGARGRRRTSTGTPAEESSSSRPPTTSRALVAEVAEALEPRVRECATSAIPAAR